LSSIPLSNIEILHQLKHFLVERARTSRRYIKLTNPPYAISDLTILEFTDEGHELNEVIQLLKSGNSIGVISESGMPGIADPGSKIVLLAHKHNLQVRALVGPSSIFLALSSSGLNGQNFCFNGYLPIKENELIKSINQIEQRAYKNKETQIFIETPYRNNRLFSNLLKNLKDQTLLCIALDLTSSNEFVKTMSIANWKKESWKFEKAPAIFLIGI